MISISRGASADVFELTYTAPLTTGIVDEFIFTANRPYQVVAVREVHSVIATIAANLQLTKDTGTDAAGAGTDLLTNNTNAGFDLNATANTVQTGTLTGTVASLQLAVGNRLSIAPSGTVTGCLGMSITVSLQAI